ncbi:MAG: TolC family protein [Bacteroidales bacterium]
MNKLITRITVTTATLIVTTMGAGAISLEECYRLTKENYPAIREYDMAEKLKDYSFSNAARSWLPQVSVSGQATYQSDVSEFPESLQKMLEQTGTTLEGLSKDQYKATLEVNQTLWDGGASKAVKEQALAQAQVDKATIDKDIDAIKKQVNQIYFGILLTDNNLQQLDYARTLLKSNLRMAKSMVGNGTALQSDVDNIQVELLSIDQQTIRLESTDRTYRKILSLMTGTIISETEHLEMPPTPKIDITLNKRSELKIFDANYNLAEANRKSIASSVMPQIGLYAQGFYGRPGLDLFDDMMNNNFSWNYIAGIRLRWNFSAFYTKKNNLQKIEVSQQKIDNQRETFLWGQDIETSRLGGEIDKMERIKQSDNEISRLRKTIRESAESKYKNGIITATELISKITDENNALLSLQTHELELLKDIYDLKVSLNQ